MLDFSVQADFREVERMLSVSQRKVLPKATTSALNKVARSVQKEALKLIAKDIGIPQREVRKHLFINKANWKDLASSIQSRFGTRTRIMDLKPRQGRRGVTYKTQGGRRLKRGAFIQKMQSGHVDVFKRDGPKGRMQSGSSKGKLRQPIYIQHTVSVSYVFIQERMKKAMLTVAKQRWGKVWPHEVRYRLQKAGYS